MEASPQSQQTKMLHIDVGIKGKIYIYEKDSRRLRDLMMRAFQKWGKQNLFDGFDRWKSAVKELKDKESAMRVKECAAIKPEIRSTGEARVIAAWLRKLKSFDGLKRSDCLEIAKYVELRVLQPGELIFLQGQIGLAYFMILSGSAKVYFTSDRPTVSELHNDLQNEMDSSELGEKLINNCRLVATMKSGVAFGELALFSDDRKRNASVIGNPDEPATTLLVLQRDKYIKLAMPLHKAALDLEEKIRALKSLGVFDKWGRSRLVLVSYLLQKRHYPRNTYLCRQGETGSEVFIIHKGEVQLQLNVEVNNALFLKTKRSHSHPGMAIHCPVITKTGKFLLKRPTGVYAEKKKKKTLHLANLRPPLILGEGVALNEQATRSASLMASTDVEAFILNKDDFIKYILQDDFVGSLTESKLREMSEFRFQMCGSIVKRSFQTLNRITLESRKIMSQSSSSRSRNHSSSSTRTPTSRTQHRLRRHSLGGHPVERHNDQMQNNIKNNNSNKIDSHDDEAKKQLDSSWNNNKYNSDHRLSIPDLQEQIRLRKSYSRAGSTTVGHASSSSSSSSITHTRINDTQWPFKPQMSSTLENAHSNRNDPVASKTTLEKLASEITTNDSLQNMVDRLSNPKLHGSSFKRTMITTKNSGNSSNTSSSDGAVGSLRNRNNNSRQHQKEGKSEFPEYKVSIANPVKFQKQLKLGTKRLKSISRTGNELKYNPHAAREHSNDDAMNVWGLVDNPFSGNRAKKATLSGQHRSFYDIY